MVITYALFFVTVARSFSSTQTFPTCTSRKSILPILCCQPTALEADMSESRLIHSIRSSQSTTDLAKILEHANCGTSDAAGSYRTLDGFGQINLNVTAATLRRLAHLSITETQQEKSFSCIENQRAKLSRDLLDRTESTLQIALEGPDTRLNPYNLADILIALGILSQMESIGISNDLLRALMNLIDRHEARSMHSVGLIRLVQCLQAISRLQLDEPKFQSCIFQRLLKPDAVAKLPARTLAHGLAALANSDTNNMDSKLLSRAFMRRLRKKKVREQSTLPDLLRALNAADKIFRKPEMDGFRDEAAIFGFTLLRDVIQTKSESNASFSTKIVSDLISTWARLSNNEREDVVIEELLNICESDGIMELCNLNELEKIMVSVERLRITNHAKLMQVAGERFLALVEGQNNSFSEEHISPRAINSILRCPVLLHRRSQDVMEPFITAAVLLFRNDSFVDSCTLSEIANFLWFKSVTRWRDQEVLQLFCQRILDPEVVDSCTPKLASRILGAFTSIISLETLEDGDDYEMAEAASQLFHCYGVHFLTSRLEPAVAVTALYSYAKASYVHDMGIFDHLASSVSLMTHRCTTRQLSQSLWSCGKMVAFEQMNGDLPPYHNSSLLIAKELCKRSNELTPPDVTQCIWALARLRVSGATYFQPLTERAVEVSQMMNTIEVVNVIWGLGKTRYIASDLLLVLTERLKKDPLDASPKQAASALFALGRLNFRDKELYDTLCAVLIDQIDATTAQSLANVLWAYKTVDLRPPDKLLNCWASEKLGLVAVQPQKTR